MADFTVQAVHAVDRPEQIHRGRPGGSQFFRDDFELRVEFRRIGFCYTDRNSHRRRDTDRGSAANDHGADRVRDLLIGPAGYVGLFGGQAGLVDHDHAFVGPLNGFYHL